MSNEPLPVQALLAQKSCCGNGCQKCPYVTKHGYRHFKGNTTIDDGWVRASMENPQLTWKEYRRNAQKLSDSG